MPGINLEGIQTLLTLAFSIVVIYVAIRVLLSRAHKGQVSESISSAGVVVVAAVLAGLGVAGVLVAMGGDIGTFLTQQ